MILYLLSATFSVGNVSFDDARPNDTSGDVDASDASV